LKLRHDEGVAKRNEVAESIPLKQGLKPTMAYIRDSVSSVAESIPLKQGLKQQLDHGRRQNFGALRRAFH